MNMMGGTDGGGGEVAVAKEDVIAKLKDDGDFDKLRLRIVRQLKDNEELRQHIASVVKQSVALNSAGAENMKPRQLSDAIYDEVGDRVMSQISDSLWQIIQSSDGMKTEIAETVQSVYDKLANPNGKNEVPLSTCQAMPTQGQQGEAASITEIGDGVLNENEPEEPPGFTLLHNHVNSSHKDQDQGKAQVRCNRKGYAADQTEGSHVLQEKNDEEDFNGNAPPGFSVDAAHSNPLSDCSDEDPDVPPGFG